MQNSKCFLVYFLSVLLALPPQAFAKSSGGSISPKAALLSAIILDEYSKVKNISEFVDTFSSSRPEAEREIIKKRMASLGAKKLLRIKPAYRGVTLYEGSFYLRIDLTRALEKKIIFNGHEVEWDPEKPLPEQADALMARLQSVTAAPPGLFSFFMPQAQAAVQAVLIGVAAYVGANIAQKASERYIGAFINGVEWEVCKYYMSKPNSTIYSNPYVCEEFKKKIVDVVASNQMLNADTKPKTITVLVENETCPHKQPKDKDKNYEANIKITNLIESSKSSKNNDTRVRVVGKYAGPNLKTIDLIKDDKNKKGELVPIIIATYELDPPSGVLKEIKIPDPETSSSKTKVIHQGRRGIPAVEVKEKDLEPAVLFISPMEDYSNDGKRKGLLAYHQEIKNAIDLRIQACIADREQKKAKDVVETRNPGSSGTTVESKGTK